MTLLLFSTAGYRGSHYDSGNSEMKIKKNNKSFLLTTVQQMQPTLTLHCPKLVQNIKIRISCDVRVYTWKILRSCVFTFPPSWIWAIGVSSCFQSHDLQKWHPWSKYMYWGNVEVLQKFEKSFGWFIQKLPSKIYKMCSISGIKWRQKKVVNNGPFP